MKSVHGNLIGFAEIYAHSTKVLGGRGHIHKRDWTTDWLVKLGFVDHWDSSQWNLHRGQAGTRYCQWSTNNRKFAHWVYSVAQLGPNWAEWSVCTIFTCFYNIGGIPLNHPWAACPQTWEKVKSFHGHILAFKIWLGQSNWHDKGQYEYFLIFRKWWNWFLFLWVFVTLARLILFEWDISTMWKGVIYNNHPVQALLYF